MNKLVPYIAGAALLLSTAGVVVANNGNQEHLKPVRHVGSTLEIHVNDNGKVLVRGAQVSSVSGTTINASTSFGSYVVNWSVKTDSNTKLISHKGRIASLADVKNGDIISFQGMLDTTASTPTVNATLVKDWSLNNLSVIQKTTFQGTLKSLASVTAPTTLVLTVGNKDYTVNVPANISILNKMWLATSLSNFQVGDTVRVYGAVQANSNTVIDATVIRDISI